MIPLVVEAALRSSVLVALVGLVLSVTRPRNVHLQKLIWVMVVLASLALPLLLHARVMPVIAAPDYVVTLQAGHGAVAQSDLAWSMAAVIYELTTLTLLGRFAYGLLRAWRICRKAPAVRVGWTQGLDVRVSNQLCTPATLGSTVLLPAGYHDWSRDKLTAVIAHERAHVSNGDCYVLWLARLHTCIFWFNPLAWWIQRRLALLAETTSDEAAVAALDDEPRYAEILLEFTRVAGGAAAAPDVAASMARPNISKRIEWILAGVAPSALPKLSQRIVVMAALLPVIAAAAVPLGSSALQLARAGSSSQAAAAGDGVRPEPSIASSPNMESYYPAEALQQRIEGMVRIRVTLDAAGRPTDTLILSEDPQGVGFGAAASAMAHVMTYRNPTGRTAQYTFAVKFALDHGPAAP